VKVSPRLVPVHFQNPQEAPWRVQGILKPMPLASPTQDTEQALLALRSEFPILGHTTYLVSHSLGAMPRAAAANLAAFAETWATRGIRAWEEGWWDSPITTGNLIGRIIGAPPGTVVMHQNVSVCQSIVLSCFDWAADPRRNVIVTDGLNFPSNDYIYHALAKQTAGPVIRTVPSPDGFTLPLEAMLAAIDETTRLVSISHVAFRSSYLQDLAAVIERAHQVGALVIADLYQSAGIVPVDVTALNVDFATGGSVKWLCGGPGAGYLYVRPDLAAQLEPAYTGWAAHAQPFAFAPGAIAYADGIARFSSGTPNVPSMVSASAGYEIVDEILAQHGPNAIRDKSLRQTRYLMDLAAEAGFPVRTPQDDARRGGAVILDVPKGAEVVKELGRREILVDHRPNAGIRMAPHFYNTDEELAHAVQQIVAIVR
jgi:kynureninase